MKLKKTCVWLHETEWLSKQQVLPKGEQKWRSNEAMILDTKVGSYCQRSRLTTENQDVLLTMQMEAQREVRGESEWMMKVIDSLRQRERGCYLVREQKSRHSGWWG